MVTKTREQIDTAHNANIQNIRAAYHERQEISHEEYHNQLNVENAGYETDEIDELKARLDKITKVKE